MVNSQETRKNQLVLDLDDAVLTAFSDRAEQAGKPLEALIQDALKIYLDLPTEDQNTSSPTVGLKALQSSPFSDDLKDRKHSGPQLRALPTGICQMGQAHGEEDELPVHQVEIEHAFAIGVYPVTFAEYDRFVNDTQRMRDVDQTYTAKKSGFWAGLRGETEIRHRTKQELALPHDETWGRSQRPVINVSWYDAVAYCNWLSEQTGQVYRLPTEAEWAYAARAGTSSHYSFGDNETALEDYAWFRDNASDRTQNVGKKLPNPWGLYDMHGNVWEWTCSLYKGHYDGNELCCPAEVKDSDYFALRGGSWYSLPHWARSASRIGRNPNFHNAPIGFRVVRMMPPDD